MALGVQALGVDVAIAGMATVAIVVLYTEKPSNGPQGGILWMLAFAVLYFVVQWHIGRIQQRLNRQIAGTAWGYFLYLRSFRERALRTTTHSGGPANPSPNAFIVDDVQDELAIALEGIGQLFVIGMQNSTSLAWSKNPILLRTRKDNWRHVFERLGAVNK